MTIEGDGRVEPDITDRRDVQGLVEEFYRRVFDDNLLAPVFVKVMHTDPSVHLPVMVDFWDTALFRSGIYRGNALRVHQHLHRQVGLTSGHFARWLELWSDVIDERYYGPRADQAKISADHIGQALQRRLGLPPASARS